MAKMGTGRMIRDPRIVPKPSESQFKFIATPYMNLVISPVQVRTISTLDVAPLGFGMPIMREGFITDTDFLPTAN
jgi:hypothetical protein